MKTNLKEELISFETAKLAKEKGWNGDFVESHKILTTQSLLQKWLRDKHKIHVEVVPDNWSETEIIWYANILDLNEFLDAKKPFFYKNKDIISNNIYEEALEQGLLEALKLI